MTRLGKHGPRVGTAPAVFPRIMGDNLEFLRALIPEVMGNGFFLGH